MFHIAFITKLSLSIMILYTLVGSLCLKYLKMERHLGKEMMLDLNILMKNLMHTWTSQLYNTNSFIYLEAKIMFKCLFNIHLVLQYMTINRVMKAKDNHV